MNVYNDVEGEESEEQEQSNGVKECEFQSAVVGENSRDPLKVMIVILRRMGAKMIQEKVQLIPESSLATAGFLATAAFVIHISFRKNARRALFNALESLFALGLSGVAVGAFSTIFAKRILLGSLVDQKSLRLIQEDIAGRLWTRIKLLAETNTRWRGILAMLVLLILGKKKSGH